MVDGPREPNPALILAWISLPIFIGALDLTVVSAVLPQVIFDLEIPIQTGLDEAAWLVSGYLLAYSVAMTFMGHLSDVFGRRRVYLLALIIFAIGSYLVAVTETWPTDLALRIIYRVSRGRPDPGQVTLVMLIVARVVQAFGGGAMVPVGMALVGDLYPPGNRAKALGFIAAVDTAGWVVGHLYGGIIVRFFDWRMIFWLNLPVCLLAFILIRRALRGLREGEEGARMDWLGALLISLSLTALNLAFGTRTETGGVRDLGSRVALPEYTFPILLGAVLFLVLFILRQARFKHPLVPLTLFRRQNFTAATIANFLVGFSLFIAIANVPLFINTLIARTLEQGAWDSGWLLSALTVPMAITALPGGWLTARSGYRLPAVLGLLTAIAGFVLMTHWQLRTTYAMMAPQLVLAGVGFGLTIAPIAAAVVDAAPEGYRGTASALVIIFRLVGMTLGVSSMTTYGLHRADVLTARLLPQGADLVESVRVGMEVMVKVINETFLIAGLICALAILPVIRLGSRIKGVFDE
ncbi:MAG: MFS transporter [Anaerolineales bacterium]|nr:MFS transporter [Anaerolineales bacterium]